MSGLSKYCEATFNQGVVLGSTYRDKRDVRNGVCAALCFAWIHMLINGADSADMDALKDEFDLSINLHRILRDAFTQTASDRMANYNSVAHVTRFRMTFGIGSSNVDPIKHEFVNVKGNPLGEPSNGPLLMLVSLEFPQGRHMIALVKVDDILVMFDPNYGVFAAQGSADIEGMAEALFAEYRSMGMTLGEWNIYGIEQAESALERFKRIAKVN